MSILLATATTKGIQTQVQAVAGDEEADPSAAEDHTEGATEVVEDIGAVVEAEVAITHTINHSAQYMVSMFLSSSLHDLSPASDFPKSNVGAWSYSERKKR